jgi:AAA15 family ATPase/GTPase
VYVAPFEHLRGNVLSQIVRNESYKNICLKALQLFDQNIENLMILRSDVGNRPVEYIKHRKLGNMPLATYGDGIKKVLVLANAIAGAAGGVLLIDEIETAIHKKYYDDIFRFVIKACKAFNVQVFITTHSLEAIDGILATSDYDAQDEEDDIKVVTLKRENDSTFSRVLPGREVFTNREAFGFEVRL